MASSEPKHTFREFFQTVVHTISLPSHITIVETMDSIERGKNPLPLTIINPWKEYWRGQSLTSDYRFSRLLADLHNSLPNDKILDQSKFKELADNKINTTKKLKFILGMVENILGKGENARYQHFLLSPKCFQKPPSTGSLKAGFV